MKLSTQKLILEYLLSSQELFSRCMPIINSEYFDPELRPAVKGIQSLYEKYNTIPKFDLINSEYDTTLTTKELPQSDVQLTCDMVENFCKQGALFKAIKDSSLDVTSGDVSKFGAVLDRVQKALSVSIQKELGVDVYADVESRLNRYLLSNVYEPTMINGIDDPLGGGFARGQVTLFSANSGGGKSIMMSNIAANYSRQGFKVLQLALELSEEMIDLRVLSILTGTSTSEWKSKLPEIVNLVQQHRDAGAGSYILKRIPGGSTALDIRSYLKLYEIEHGSMPDVLIVDYLDLMSPNGGSQNKGIFEQDKEKAEQLSDIAFEFDMITITASQQNRESVRAASPDQASIAGGISKINTVDNYISIYMNPEMRLKGEMFIYFLKTRSSSAVGTMSQLSFNPDNLIISDKKITIVSVIDAIKARSRAKKVTNNPESVSFPGIDGEITMNIPDEFADIIVRYHEEEDKIHNPYNDTDKKPAIDLADDANLWDKPTTKFKLTQLDERDELYDILQM